MAEQFVCEPLDINAKVHLFDSFNNKETEISAGWIVRFCQQRKKGWEPFSYEDIDRYYKSRGRKEKFWFNRLVTSGFILKEDDKYIITPGFVYRCHKSSPAKK